jgi:hypothetical protein
MASLTSSGATSSSVNTDWRRSAGDYECLECKRKRLPASEFSKTQSNLALKTFRSGGKMIAQCKKCVETSAGVVATKATTTNSNAGVAAGGAGRSGTGAGARARAGGDPVSAEILTCSSCEKDLPSSSFTNSQKTKWSRGKKVRCRDCVAREEEEEIESKKAAQEKTMMDMEKNAQRKGSNGVAARLALACTVTAGEAATVTGIKVKKGRGGGGRWRGRGRGK